MESQEPQKVGDSTAQKSHQASFDSSIKFSLPQDTAEYMAMVEQFSALVDHAFKNVEAMVSEQYIHDVALRLPSLISLVNTIAMLRGDNDAFTAARPESPERQGELYRLEEMFRTRLEKLISLVEASSERDLYQKHLGEYYYQIKS